MKRGQAETSGSPPAKKQFVAIPAVSIGPVSTEEEMNMKVLSFQNKKLAEKIEERKAEEEKLKEEMEALKLQRKFDLDIISVVHRHWMQLDEDVKNMLQRYEGETEENSDQTITGELPSVSYLEHLSSLDPAAIREEVDRRTESSKRAVQKLLQYMSCREITASHSSLVVPPKEGVDAGDEGKAEYIEDTDKERNATKHEVTSSDLSKEIENLQTDNKRLEEVFMSMQQKLNTTSLEFSELRDKYAVAQKEISLLNTQVQDAEYDLQKAAHRVEKLVKRLTEVEVRAKQADGGETSGGAGTGASSGSSTSSSQMDEVKSEVEEMRELVEKRLEELQALHEKYTTSQQEVEKLKLEASQVPESVVVQSATYKCLQVQFSVVYGEATQLRQQLDDTRRVLSNCKTQNLLQMEQIEADNVAMQKKFKAEVNELHETLLQVKRDYDMLRMDFEQNLKSTEQTVPMTKEMHHLINCLQNHNQQLKGEVNRYKRKFTETQEQKQKLQEDLNNLKNSEGREKKTKEATNSNEKDSETAESAEKRPRDEEEGELNEGEDQSVPSAEAEQQVKNLQSELKKAQESQKEMKLLLDLYKGAAKDLRDRAELLTVENRLKDEIEELKAKVEEQEGELRKYKGALADEEAIRRLKVAEETIDQLQKNLAATKQEEDALLAEMEFTGQAFEEMQEQNVRLLQQLREKDDANLKLMSERIKASQIQKQLREEKDVLADHVTSLNTYRDTQSQAIRKMEEREKILSNALASMEKEMTLRQQAMDFHKRKAIECAQSVQELKLRHDALQHQTQEIQSSLAEKTRCCEEEQFRARRVQEECLSLRRKVEKQKKMDMYGAADEVLLEEIREYKAKLTCPCCNIRKKDAILTKCFHVFCFECLKTRYDTRQRKCPKCNATFGNNDYHKIYLI